MATVQFDYEWSGGVGDMKRALALIVVGATLWFVPSFAVMSLASNTAFCTGLGPHNVLFSSVPTADYAEGSQFNMAADHLTQRITCTWPDRPIRAGLEPMSGGSLVVKPGMIHYVGVVVLGIGVALTCVRLRSQRLSTHRSA